MRILSISPIFIPIIDGVTRLIYDQNRKLVERGHEVHLITRRFSGNLKNEVVEGIKVTRVKPFLQSFPAYFARQFPWGHYALTSISLCPNQSHEVVRLLKHEHFDILHAYGHLSAVAGVFGKVVYHTPLIVTIAGTGGLLGTWGRNETDPVELRPFAIFERLLSPHILEFCDRIIVPSLFAKKVISGIVGSEANIDIIPNSVDLNRFSCQPKLQEKRRAALVLFVGFLTSRKGVDVLIRAIPKVVEREPETRFLIVGGGSVLKQSLMKSANDLGIEEAVHFLGEVEDRDLLRYYSVADVFVLPSFFDPLATALIEAMAMGVPVVATRCSAISEIVDDGKNGILVGRGDATELASAIIHVLSNPELRREMRMKGLEIIRAKHDLDLTIKKLEKLLYSSSKSHDEGSGKLYEE